MYKNGTLNDNQLFRYCTRYYAQILKNLVEHVIQTKTSVAIIFA